MNRAQMPTEPLLGASVWLGQRDWCWLHGSVFRSCDCSQEIHRGSTPPQADSVDRKLTYHLSELEPRRWHIDSHAYTDKSSHPGTYTCAVQEDLPPPLTTRLGSSLQHHATDLAVAMQSSRQSSLAQTTSNRYSRLLKNDPAMYWRALHGAGDLLSRHFHSKSEEDLSRIATALNLSCVYPSLEARCDTSMDHTGDDEGTWNIFIVSKGLGNYEEDSAVNFEVEVYTGFLPTVQAHSGIERCHFANIRRSGRQ
jgi:hypothetical protein